MSDIKVVWAAILLPRGSTPLTVTATTSLSNSNSNSISLGLSTPQALPVPVTPKDAFAGYKMVSKKDDFIDDSKNKKNMKNGKDKGKVTEIEKEKEKVKEIDIPYEECSAYVHNKEGSRGMLSSNDCH